MTKVLRGFYIRTVTGNQKTDLTHAWSEAGTLPAEWDQTKADPQVKEAQIFSGTQRHRQHQKRKILESYTSDTTETGLSEDAEMSESLKQMLENRLDG